MIGVKELSLGITSPWAYFAEFDIFPVFFVVVVPERDEVVVVGKGHDSPGVVSGDGKEVLEDVHHSRAQPGLEVVKDEVRVRLRHGAQLRNVVPHHHVWKKKGMISCSSPKLFHFMIVCESFRRLPCWT